MDEKIIELNRPQLLIHAVNANKTYALWGRGTGKTNGALGPRTIHLFNAMPRAQIGLVVPTYEMATLKILPNIFGFWQNEMGYVEGEDYVFGIKPPEEWQKPYIPILNFKNVISMPNGCAMPVLSLAVEGAGNGFNLQALIGDEAKFFSEKKLKEIIRALRGCRHEFGHLAEFQSQWYFTDKYDGDVQWMLNKRDLVNNKMVAAVVKMQTELNRLENEDGPKEKINHYRHLLFNARKNMVFVSEASSFENEEILGEKYFNDQRESSTAIEFNVAIKNEDPVKVENAFYPNFAERHYYQMYNDTDVNLPLIIAADYQWRISPIVQAQYAVLPGANKPTLNFTYSCHTLAPESLQDAIDKWCFHNRNHQNKTVYYVFDKTATHRSSTSSQHYIVVTTRLEYHSWNVIQINTGDQPKHDAKFKSINNRLKDEINNVPIRINSITNTDLIKSINLTGAKTVSGKTAKDKSKELNASIPAVHTTHYSDTFDMILHADDLGVISPDDSTFFVATLYQ